MPSRRPSSTHRGADRACLVKVVQTWGAPRTTRCGCRRWGGPPTRCAPSGRRATGPRSSESGLLSRETSRQRRASASCCARTGTTPHHHLAYLRLPPARGTWGDYARSSPRADLDAGTDLGHPGRRTSPVPRTGAKILGARPGSRVAVRPSAQPTRSALDAGRVAWTIGHRGTPTPTTRPPRTASRDTARAWLPRRAQLAAGRLPTHRYQVPSALPVLRRPRGLSAVRASRRAFCVTLPSDSGSGGTRPVGGACGPCRAALKTYRKFSPHRHGDF
jgi:hypothetical protein